MDEHMKSMRESMSKKGEGMSGGEGSAAMGCMQMMQQAKKPDAADPAGGK